MRAQKAEAHIEELKDQLQRAKSELAEKDREGGAATLRAILGEAGEKGRWASANLRKTVGEADVAIKQLVAGAQALKDVAAVLQTIDKMATT